MRLFWADFLRYVALQSSKGSVRQLDGVEGAWVHSTLIVNNGTFLSSPASSETDLKARLTAAVGDALPHQLPWAFYLYEPYVAGLSSEQVTAMAAEAGLNAMMRIEVMTGDIGELQAPTRPLPDLAFRRIENRDEAWIAMDINLRSYGMPLSMADSVLETNAYFSNPQREFAFLAYAGGTPVSTAMVVELDGWLYVALVATDPDHRQRGYAETVMRHALKVAAAELRISQTALDASAMGAPLYQTMGYRRTGEAWTMYTN